MTLVTILVYLIFFKKVTVMIFGANGTPDTMRKAKKKQNKLFLSNKITLDIMNNYRKMGKKTIYFGYQVDEQTVIPFSIVNEEEEITKIEIQNNQKQLQKKAEKLSQINYSTRYQKLIKQLSKQEKSIEILEEKLAIEQNKLENGYEKILFFIQREKIIFSIQKKIKLGKKQLERLKTTEKKILELEEKKYEKLIQKKSTQQTYSILPKLKIDYEWNSIAADAYEESTKRFQFGLQKFAPFITVTVTIIFCVILVLGSMRYATTIEPIELEAIKEISNQNKQIAQYYTEGSKANKAIVEKINFEKNQNNQEVPK